jgi:hypothetical protein
MAQKHWVPDNLDDGPALLGPLMGGGGLETISMKQTIVGGEHIRALNPLPDIAMHSYSPALFGLNDPTGAVCWRSH